MAEPRQLLVLTTPTGRTLTIAAVDDALVVDDTGECLGELQGDVTPFVVAIDGSPHVIAAGAVGGGDRAARVVVEFPHDTQTCPIAKSQHCGVWMTFPEPFQEGMTIAAVWHDDAGHELWRIVSQPLTADRLGPIFGPTWTGYAPL